MPQPDILISKPLWTLSEGLLTALRKHQEEHFKSSGVVRSGAFMLDPGMGPSTYLTVEGRIVWEEASFWGVQGTLQEALGGVVVGIKKTGVKELAELLPARPESASTCLECEDGNWVRGHLSIICPACTGLGWTDPTIDLKVSVL